ncbi:hypothetical protein AACH06_23875 [Ideonella sp. DXS29W]|uniref:Uncharacterized protein n=1 Tax=Ideonella lacteola TaxID=2984193 RepID=A0ABU9BZ83_9BURK
MKLAAVPSISRAAVAVAMLLSTGIAPAQSTGHSLSARSAAPVSPAGELGVAGAWERLPGCARNIAAGTADQVIVTGCEPRASAVRDLFRYEAAGSSPGRFVPMGGQASAVAIGGPDSQGVWAIGPQGQVFASTGGVFDKPTAAGTVSWVRVDFSATSIAAGPDSVWIVTTRPHVSPYGNVAAYGRLQCDVVGRGATPCRVTGWSELPIAAAQVALGDEPWIVDTQGTIQRLSAGRWQTVPGCARAIAARGAHVWILSCGASTQPGGQEVLQWTRQGWAPTGGYGQALAVDSRGDPWVVDAQGGIWHQRRQRHPQPFSTVLSDQHRSSKERP